MTWNWKRNFDSQFTDELAAQRVHFAQSNEVHTQLIERLDKGLHEQQLHLEWLRKEFEDASRVKQLEATVNKAFLEIRDLNIKLKKRNNVLDAPSVWKNSSLRPGLWASTDTSVFQSKNV